MADIADFQYEQLTDAASQIRLVKLCKDLETTTAEDTTGKPPEGMISMTLEVADMSVPKHERNPDEAYHALSYCWGDESDKLPILMNGKRKLVTRNLHAALHRIWRSTFPEYDFLSEAIGYGHPLWIDALCINQDDNTEKGQQVQRMGRIFSDAGCVYAWLGPDDEELRVAGYMLFRLDLRQREDFDPCPYDEEYRVFYSDLDDWLVDDIRRAELFFHFDMFLEVMADSDYRILHSLERFAKLPWWSRAWVCTFTRIAVATMVLTLVGCRAGLARDRFSGSCRSRDAIRRRDAHLGKRGQC